MQLLHLGNLKKFYWLLVALLTSFVATKLIITKRFQTEVLDKIINHCKKICEIGQIVLIQFSILNILYLLLGIYLSNCSHPGNLFWLMNGTRIVGTQIMQRLVSHKFF